MTTPQYRILPTKFMINAKAFNQNDVLNAIRSFVLNEPITDIILKSEDASPEDKEKRLKDIAFYEYQNLRDKSHVAWIEYNSETKELKYIKEPDSADATKVAYQANIGVMKYTLKNTHSGKSVNLFHELARIDDTDNPLFGSETEQGLTIKLVYVETSKGLVCICVDKTAKSASGFIQYPFLEEFKKAMNPWTPPHETQYVGISDIVDFSFEDDPTMSEDEQRAVGMRSDLPAHIVVSTTSGVTRQELKAIASTAVIEIDESTAVTNAITERPINDYIQCISVANISTLDGRNNTTSYKFVDKERCNEIPVIGILEPEKRKTTLASFTYELY